MEINNQYDFFKNIKLDEEGNLLVSVVSGSNPGQVGITTELETTSTLITKLYEIEFDTVDKRVGQYHFELIGVRGNSATFYTTNILAYNIGASPKVVEPSIPNNDVVSIPIDFGTTLGLLEIFSDAVENKVIFRITPNSTTATQWKLNIREITLP